MAEHYLDIIPPGAKIEREQNALPKNNNIRKRFRPIAIFLPLVGLFLVLFAAAHFALQKAQVKIWPSFQEVSAQEEVQIQENAAVSFSNLVLPFQELKVSQKISQSFPASFVIQERRAEGVIKIYNFYSPVSLNFVAQTRFLSAEGKLFRAPNKIVIPGRTAKGAETQPGIAEIRVVAAEPGESYNIGPTRFSLPGLAGSPGYTLVYGESSEPMRGGFSGQGRMILQDDLDNAQKTLSGKIREENIKNLENKFASSFVLLQDSLSHEILEANSSMPAGEQKDGFDYALELETKILGVKMEILRALSLELLNKLVQKDQELHTESLDIVLTKKSFDQEKNGGVFLLRVSAKIYPKEDISALKNSLAGFKKDQALFLLKNRFEKSEIDLTPFWLNSFPKDPEKITIKLILD